MVSGDWVSVRCFPQCPKTRQGRGPNPPDLPDFLSLAIQVPGCLDTMQEQEAKDPEREEGQELSPEGEPVLEHGSRLRGDSGFGGHKNLE